MFKIMHSPVSLSLSLSLSRIYALCVSRSVPSNLYLAFPPVSVLPFLIFQPFVPALSPSPGLFLPRLRLKFCAVSFALRVPSFFSLFSFFSLSLSRARLCNPLSESRQCNLYRIPGWNKSNRVAALGIGIELTWVADSWRRVRLHNRHVFLSFLFFFFFFFFFFLVEGVERECSKHYHAPFHFVTGLNRLTSIPNLSAVIISVLAYSSTFQCSPKINSVTFVRSDVLTFFTFRNEACSSNNLQQSWSSELKHFGCWTFYSTNKKKMLREVFYLLQSCRWIFWMTGLATKIRLNWR